MSSPFKMNPGRGSMEKTGRGIPQTFKSPNLQKEQTDPVSGFVTAYSSARKAGKKTFDYQGKPYSTLSKEEAEENLEFGNRNVNNFKGNNPRMNASDSRGKDTGNFQYAKYMGYTNKQIGENVEKILDTQKNAAHALGRGKEATKFENPFKGY